MEFVDYLASSNYVIVNKIIAEQVGLNEALVLGELASEYKYWQSLGKLDDGWFYSTVENLAERLPISSATIRRAVEKLEGDGYLETKLSGMPAKKYYRLLFGKIDKHGCSNRANKVAQIEQQKNNKEQYTTTTPVCANGSILDYGMMKALVQKFVRDHQSQSDPISFTPSKLKEYYPSLKEWAIDNGINLDRAMVNTVLENAYSEMTNDGWLAGKDIAIAFKDTCIGTRIKKQQKKGGLNDNEW